MEIKNAIISDVNIEIDRGTLSAWVQLDYGGCTQGFGGYNLSYPKFNAGGHFVFQCLRVVGVENWKQMQGKAVRAMIEDGLVKAIGNIIKEDWFNPSEDFKKMEAQ